MMSEKEIDNKKSWAVLDLVLQRNRAESNISMLDSWSFAKSSFKFEFEKHIKQAWIVFDKI